jgi:protein subunit release factor B
VLYSIAILAFWLDVLEEKALVTFAVSEEKNDWLRRRMEALGISERDLEERFVRSSGKGGQKVNKTSSCVHLKHVPTGIEVKCMKDRSQSVNRFLARRELVGRIEGRLGFRTSEDAQREGLRKQKMRRQRRSQRKYGTPSSTKGSD